MVHSIVRQKNSWSRLQISRTGFIQLLCDIGASTGFGDFAQAFGFKSSGKDENFGGYHRHIHYRNSEELRYGTRQAYSPHTYCLLTITQSYLISSDIQLKWRGRRNIPGSFDRWQFIKTTVLKRPRQIGYFYSLQSILPIYYQKMRETARETTNYRF